MGSRRKGKSQEALRVVWGRISDVVTKGSNDYRRIPLISHAYCLIILWWHIIWYLRKWLGWVSETWYRRRSVKNSTKSIFWVKVCICQNCLSINVMCLRIVKVLLAYVSERKHWHQPSKKTFPQHLFTEPNSVVINHVVLHSDNHSIWLQKRKKISWGDLLLSRCWIQKTDDISTVGYTARIEVLAEIPIVLFDSRLRLWDFSFYFIRPAAISPWSGLSLLEKWVSSWVKKTAGE